MSADYGTKSFVGYHHKDGVVIYWRDSEGSDRLGYLDPGLVSELQSITDQWKRNIDDIRADEVSSGDDCPGV